MSFNPSSEAKRFALRLNQLFNPELYPTEKPVLLKDIWKELCPHVEKITILAEVIRSIYVINPEVKEK